MVYLDYNSTTPIDERVLDAMMPYFKDKFGNASSATHSYGWRAKDAVDKSRSQVAKLIGCLDQEVVFTSGSTESINLALKGIFSAYKKKGNHIVTCKTEHKAVLDVCSALERQGGSVTYLSVDEQGHIDLKDLERAITEKTILVAVMMVNNETGVIHPIKEIADIVHKRDSILFCDATQAIGKIPVNVIDLGVDVMTMSAHKFYGPKGLGALYVRRKNPRVTITPLIDGGGHERGRRSGTLNVPGIVGIGEACKLASDEMDKNEKQIRVNRDYLEQELLELGNTFLNGDLKSRIYNTSNICFRDLKAEDVINASKSLVAIATGSACTSADQKPSHVLKAMGLSKEGAYGSVRFSLGKYNTSEEIKGVVEQLSNKIRELRAYKSTLYS